MDQARYAEWYRLNSITFRSSTVNLHDLMRYLFQRNLLNQTKIAEVNEKAGDALKSDELFDHLTRLGVDKIDDIIACLRTTQNHSVADAFCRFKTDPGPAPEFSTIETGRSVEGVVWVGVKDNVASFHGRLVELQELHDLLVAAQQKNVQTCVIVSAFAGMGKSSLCRAYTHEYFNQFYDRNAIWLNAETPQTLSQSFEELLQSLGIQNEANGKKKDLETLAAEVYTNFRGKMVLVVFDNTEEYQLINPYLPHKLPPGFKKPSILITTQKGQLIEPPTGVTYPLKALSPDDGLEFIRKNLPDSTLTTETSARELYNTMEGHPLALQQSVGYIRKTNEDKEKLGLDSYTVAMYLLHFRSFRDVTPAGAKNKLPKEILLDYGKTAADTLKLSFNKIKADPEYGIYAATALEIVACFDPEEILVSIVTAVLRQIHFGSSATVSTDEEMDKIQEAVLLPASYNLYELNRGKIRIHRLVQFILLTNEDADQVRGHVFKYIQSLQHLEDDTVLAHAMAAWSHCRNNDLLKNHLPVLCKIADVLNKSRRWMQARIFCVEHAETVRRLEQREGEGQGQQQQLSTDFADAKCSLARCLQETVGLWQKAYDLFKEGHRAYERILGTNRIETMNAKYGMAVALHQLGRFEEAVAAHKEVYELQRNVLGEEHPDTLKNLVKIGVSGDFLCWYKEGAEIYSKVYEIRNRTLGPDDPLTLEARHNMACALHYLKREEEALVVYREVYERQVVVLGPEHRDTVNNKHMMSITLDALKKYEEAVVSFQEVFEVQERILGRDHPDTAMTNFNMALSLLRLKRYPEAIKANQDALDIQRRVLGEEHFFTKKTANNLRVCIQRMNQS